MTDLRDKIAGVLNIEGAFCGTCDREPGDSLYCKRCERVLNGYADAVLAVLAVADAVVTVEQIERAIMGRTITAGAKAVMALLRGEAGV